VRPIPKRTFNILLTCVGRRVSLMESFRRAMRELALRGKIVATDITRTSPGFQVADAGVIVPGAAAPEYIPALLKTVREHEASLLVPVTDLDLLLLARHRRQFEELGCTVMSGSEEIVAACMDKAHTNALVRQAGLPCIETCTLEEFRREPFYPCFIKPIHGSAGIGTSIIGSAAQLEVHVGRFGDRMLIQEYVPGQEFTIDVYRSRDGRVRCVVPRQRLVVRSGEVEKGLTLKDKALVDATLKLCAQLGDLWGVFCCQCRRADSRGAPFFFEINTRFGGGAPLSIAAGADLPLYLLQEVTGRPITARLGQFQDRLLMLRYDQAVFVPAGEMENLPGFKTPQFR
jgi:carbamoyl-phosphate synthase large subunit